VVRGLPTELPPEPEEAKRFDLFVLRLAVLLHEPSFERLGDQVKEFTDVTPRGPDGIFTSQQVDDLIAALRGVYATATAA
jgi:hypothetical protein